MPYRTILTLFLITTCETFIDPAVALSAEEPPSTQQPWDTDFGKPGADGTVYQVAVVPSGPEAGVYFGGEFRHIAGKYIPGLARFDGAKWHQVGDGCPCSVTTLVVDPEVQPPVVYVAGKAHLSGATIVAEYRNAQWRTLAEAVVGLNERVYALTIHPANGARYLVIGGSFTEVRAKTTKKLAPETGMGVAVWDGKSWFPLGEGFQGQSISSFGGFGGSTSTGPHAVRALLSTVESGRPVLYAGGDFTLSGKTPLPGLARWERPTWRPVDGIVGTVQALCMYDDGAGKLMYAGGRLHIPNDYKRISAVWRRIEGQWQLVGAGLQDSLDKPLMSFLTPISYRGKSTLLACGYFGASGSTKLPNVGYWDGEQWSVPDWFTGDAYKSPLFGLTSVVAHGDALYFGGSFNQIGNRPADKIARIGNSASLQPTEAAPTPLPPSLNLADLKYRLLKVTPASRWSSADLRYAALSNTGRVAVANPTKIAVPVEVAAPLFEDNPFTRPQRGIPNDPHLMRERILLWDKANQDKSITLPGGEPKYAWKTVCLSPNGNHVVANELHTLGYSSSYQWDGKKWQPVPRPQNQELIIKGVNDSGLMVGSSDVGDPREGCEAAVVRSGRMQILPSPAHKAVAWAVSNSGLIAGQARDKFGTPQACLWKDDQPTLLGTLGGKASIAHAVNDSGMVVGLSRTDKDEEAAFVWQNGQMRPLMDTSKTCSIAYGINNSGVIVGLAYKPKTYGFIASGDQVLNLNDLLVESPGWKVTRAIAVNDQNCVLAVAENESQEHLVLLTPRS